MESKITIIPETTLIGGPNGAGKGTLTDEALAGKEEKFMLLATGNIIRSEVKNQTPLGKKAQNFMESGLLVPDNLIIDMVINAIKASEKPVILDGFPRNVAQADALLRAGIIPKKMIFVNLKDEIIIDRLSNRVVCKNCGRSHSLVGPKRPKLDGICDKCHGELHRRKDDLPEVVCKRLEVYRTETAPVMDFLSKAGVPVYCVNNDHPGAQDEFTRLLFQ